MSKDTSREHIISDALDSAARTIGDDTLRKLRTARHQALDQEHRITLTGWLPVGNTVAITGGAVTATIAVAVLVVWLGIVAPYSRVNAIEDAELLASVDGPELFEQVDFYDWLESQQGNGISAS